jgi:hypothetical protein
MLLNVVKHSHANVSLQLNFLSQMKRKEEIWKSSGPSIAGTPGFGDDCIDPWPRNFIAEIE